MKVVVFVILARNYPEFSAIKPFPLFSSARGTHLRLRPANNTVYDDVCVAQYYADSPVLPVEFFGRFYQIPVLRVYRKHDRSLQGPTSWIKQQGTRQGFKLHRFPSGCSRFVSLQSHLASTDCALKLQKREADFGIFTAEEAILMSKFDQLQERKVVAEIRNTERETAKFKFETVAVIKGDFSGPLTNLKGKNFCHPGFSSSQIWTDRVLKHFERVVLNTTVKCDRSLRSSVESELHALSSFFTRTCRPGEWLPVTTLFWKKEKRRIQQSMLTVLFRKWMFLQSSFRRQSVWSTRLFNKYGGDIAYVSKYYVRLYFGLEIIQGILNRQNIDVNQYNYLCPNGTTQPLSTEEPCTWIAQPWDSIITRNEETASGVSTELQKYLPSQQLRSSALAWVDTLIKIVLGNDNKLFIEPRIFSLKEYIQAGREIPEEGTTLPCQHPIRWCTVSAKETEKCEWIKQAGITQGIVPELKCVQALSKEDCLGKISKGEADIMGIDTNIGTIAEHYYNLSTVLYQEIENQNACFPEYGGLAWTAFTNEIADSGNDYCPYDLTLGDFFTESCAPGANSRLAANTTADAKFCKLCRDASDNGITPLNKEISCDLSNRNKFYGDIGALHCLATGVADVAVINTYNLSSHLNGGELAADFSEKYSVLCKNGTKVSLTKKIDDNCAIITVTGGEIITRKNSSRIERRDLGITLETYADSFGYFNRHYMNIFHMFEPFDGTTDLLFRNEALQFVTIHDRNDDPYIAMKKLCRSNTQSQDLRTSKFCSSVN
ncbi:hypothetical protein L9F63_021874 [Diploptera punctata]|uniref:Transferrin-like domain-containing protein n=1 Tax=Diploptera punctata TaxID=6984 RepID=A0AAD8EBI2_DIPPU|nr:hypothetical protein L9F63_021874 [Diploptera punctata]